MWAITPRCSAVYHSVWLCYTDCFLQWESPASEFLNTEHIDYQDCHPRSLHFSFIRGSSLSPAVCVCLAVCLWWGLSCHFHEFQRGLADTWFALMPAIMIFGYSRVNNVPCVFLGTYQKRQQGLALIVWPFYHWLYHRGISTLFKYAVCASHWTNQGPG